MPKSKRKAIAARVAAKAGAATAPARDFEKKKSRLGKRERPTNVIDSSAVRSRKIFVPPQDKGETPESHGKGFRRAASSRGDGGGKPRTTSVDELVSRAQHYNTHARATALTGLARIFGAGGSSPDAATAHVALEVGDVSGEAKDKLALCIGADAGPVLRVGLESLQDEDPGVRHAGLSAALAVLERVPGIRPFARIVAAQLSATLSHIRSDVRVAGARAVCAVFEHGRFHPSEIFAPGTVNALPLLAALLADLSSHKTRATAANAIAALSTWSPRRQDVDGASDIAGLQKRAFYYHGGPRLLSSSSFGLSSSMMSSTPRDVAASANVTSHLRMRLRHGGSNEGGHGDDMMGGLPLFQLDEEGAGTVVRSVANMVLEYLPVHETYAEQDGKSDREQRVAALVAGTRALSTIVCAHSLGSALGIVKRVVHQWRVEQVSGGLATVGAVDVDVSMASVALVVGEWETVGKLLEDRLGRALSDERSPILAVHGETMDKEDWGLFVDLADRVLRACPHAAVRRSVMQAWMGWWRGVAAHGVVAEVQRWVGTLRFVLLSQLADGGGTSSSSSGMEEEEGEEEDEGGGGGGGMWDVVVELVELVGRLAVSSMEPDMPGEEERMSGGAWDTIRQVVDVVWEVCRRRPCDAEVLRDGSLVGADAARAAAAAAAGRHRVGRAIGALLRGWGAHGPLSPSSSLSSLRPPGEEGAFLLARVGVEAVGALACVMFYCGCGASAPLSELLGRCGVSRALWGHACAVGRVVEAASIHLVAGAGDGAWEGERLGVLAGALTCGLGVVRAASSPSPSPSACAALSEHGEELLSLCARVARSAGADADVSTALLTSAGATQAESSMLASMV